MADVQGTCDPRFDGLRAALQQGIDTGEELGASFVIDIDGEIVVDLWGGTATPTGPAPGTSTRSSTSGRRPRR